MGNYSIDAEVREKVGKSEKPENKIPAIVYGKGEDNVMLWVDSKIFTKTYQEAGESSIVDLAIGSDKNGEPEKVLIYDIQRDPVLGHITHIDFFRVKMDERIEARVPLNFIGEAPAVKEFGGILVKSIDEVEVGCLPADLPRQIDVDTSVLKTFEDYIYIKDLDISEKVTIDLGPETVVALVSAPRTQEDLESLDGEIEGDVSQVEGMEKEGEDDGDEKEEKKESEPKKEE